MGVSSCQCLDERIRNFEEHLATVNGNVAQAMELASQQRFESARIHTRLYHITAFFNRIKTSANESVKPVLTDLAILFGLYSIEKDAALFLTSGFLHPKISSRLPSWLISTI